PERDLEWSESGVEGAYRFLHRVWRLYEDVWPHIASRASAGEGAAAGDGAGPDERDLRRTVHRTIRKVTEDIEERFAFNTAISAIMEMVNELYAYKGRPQEQWHAPTLVEALRTLTVLLAPFAPHIAEELWHRTDGQGSVHEQPWPAYDPDALRADTVTVVVQVNGRVRDHVEVAVDADQAVLEQAALASERVQPFLAGKTARKVIVVPNTLVNVVAS